MPRKRKKNPQEIINRLCFGAFLLICLLGIVFTILEKGGKLTYQEVAAMLGLSPPAHVSESGVAVYFLDVGQGDSSVISVGETTVLIDSGESDQLQTVSAFLERQEITRLDYVIGTHPHSDHIGSLSRILDEFEIGKVILPSIPEEQIPTSVCYEKLLEVIDRKEIPVDFAVPGTVYSLGEGMELKILAPLSQNLKGLNNYSVVSMFTHGKNRFLFMGDAETPEEKELLDSFTDLSADVIKLGHHGSSTSTGKKFLMAVSPDTAVISVGAGNSFSHPSEKILTRLSDYGVDCYRTDQNGMVIAESDGRNIKWITET